MSMVWPCPLTAGAYALMGRAVRVPRPQCSSCSSPVVFWSGYWRHVRWQERERKIFVPRVRCRGCGVTHALLPAFVLARRLDAAESAGAVIAEAANPRLSASERGSVVRAITARQHAHPDGTVRRYSRGTVDRWLRAWRAGGAAALRPSPRSDTGKVRAMPELFGEAAALRLELPGRSAAQIASILYHRHGVRVAERTVSGQLRRAGL